MTCEVWHQASHETPRSAVYALRLQISMVWMCTHFDIGQKPSVITTFWRDQCSVFYIHGKRLTWTKIAIEGTPFLYCCSGRIAHNIWNAMDTKTEQNCTKSSDCELVKTVWVWFSTWLLSHCIIAHTMTWQSLIWAALLHIKCLPKQFNTYRPPYNTAIYYICDQYVMKNTKVYLLRESGQMIHKDGVKVSV